MTLGELLAQADAMHQGGALIGAAIGSFAAGRLSRRALRRMVEREFQSLRIRLSRLEGVLGLETTSGGTIRPGRP